MTPIIRCGICSFGMSGKLFHAPFVEAHPGFQLAAIVERHQEISRTIYPSSTLYRSVEELAADTSISLVVVNTPTHLHFQHAMLMLEAGKDIIIEKPFTVTVAEAEQLIRKAGEKGRFLSVYQNRRYDGDYLSVKEVIDNQMLGELREVEIRYDRYRPTFGGKEHKEGSLPGAGILYDLSPHLVDQAIRLFGFPNAVFADLLKMRDDVAATDYFEMIFFYPKMRVRLKATCIARETGFAYILHGMKGSFLQQRSDLQEQELQKGTIPAMENWCSPPPEPDGVLHTEYKNRVIRQLTRSSPGNYMHFYSEVYEAITSGKRNPVPPEEAVLNMRIIEAALESSGSGRIIPLN